MQVVDSRARRTTTGIPEQVPSQEVVATYRKVRHDMPGPAIETFGKRRAAIVELEIVWIKPPTCKHLLAEEER